MSSVACIGLKLVHFIPSRVGNIEKKDEPEKETKMARFNLGFPPRIDKVVKGMAYIFDIKLKTAKKSSAPSAE